MATLGGGGGAGQNQLMDMMMISQILNALKDGTSLWGILMVPLIQSLSKYGPQITASLWSILTAWLFTLWQTKFQSKIDNALQSVEMIDNEIVFTRIYDGKGSVRGAEAHERTDAVLFYVAKLPVARKMLYVDGIHLVNNKVEFNITDKIKFQLEKLDFTTEYQLSQIRFKLSSKLISVCELRNYVDSLLKEYLIEKRNRLGNDLYFFDHHVLLKRPNVIGMMATSSSSDDNNSIEFTKNLFVTNRSLHNVFFEQRIEVMNRVQFFMNRKDWYDTKGIPYTLGFLLHGAPGCGKTSMVKAIANMTHRHVININLGKIKTKSQLKELFYSDRIEVLENTEVGAHKQSYIIPINQRLYVIEDIDCLNGDVLKKRSEKTDNNNNNSEHDQSESNNTREMLTKPHHHGQIGGNEGDWNEGGGISGYDAPGWSGMSTLSGTHAKSTSIAEIKSRLPGGGGQPKKPATSPEEDKGDLDLASILNIMDGTLETPGRIIIITSNYPEKLDHAFIRPGRIDMIIEFKKANQQIVAEMFESFYDKPAPAAEIAKIQNYKWTPAEVSQILFKYFNEPEQSLHDLANEDPKKYFKFSYFENDNITTAASEDDDDNVDVGDDTPVTNIEELKCSTILFNEDDAPNVLECDQISVLEEYHSQDRQDIQEDVYITKSESEVTVDESLVVTTEIRNEIQHRRDDYYESK